MKNQYLTNIKPMNRKSKRPLLIITLSLTFFAFAINSCDKKDNTEIEQVDEYSYEVECEYCEISYTDKSNSTKKVQHSKGKWDYKFDSKITFELRLSVTTTLRSHQTIEAYVLKNNEVVFGDIGYNYTTITYNTNKSKGTANYGSY